MAEKKDADSTATSRGQQNEEYASRLELNLSVITAQLHTIQSNTAELQAKVDTTEAMVAKHREAIQALREWHRRNQHSYLRRLDTRLVEQLEQGKADLERERAIIESYQPPEIGKLETSRRSFTKTVIIGTAVTAAITVVILYLINRAPRIWKVLPFTPSPSKVILVAVIALVVIWLLALIEYYRKWSEFQRYVGVQLGMMKAAQNNFAQTHEEIQRLSSLTTQTREWLELLATTLQRPWAVKETWLEGALALGDASTLPFAMRIAAAQEGDLAASRAMERVAIERLVRPGWRKEAFEALLDSICIAEGMPQDRFNSEALDSDLPSASNGTRRLLRARMQDQPTLVRVAEPRLLDLAHEIQTRALSEIPPPVRLNQDFPLESLHYDRAGIKDVTVDRPWEEFLSEVIGTSRDPITPLSPLTFSMAARARGIHQNVRTFLEVPERLREVAMLDRRNYRARVHDTETVNPMDLVVRMDLVGPVTADDLLLLSTETAQQAQPELQEQRCPTCGRPGCPEFKAGMQCTNFGV